MIGRGREVEVGGVGGILGGIDSWGAVSDLVWRGCGCTLLS